MEATITDYTFLPFDAEDTNRDRKGKAEGNVYMLLEFTPDGADEPIK